MDDNIVDVRETVMAVLAIILILAGFALVGTIDHDEEVRHEQWMAQLEEDGAWVLR